MSRLTIFRGDTRRFAITVTRGGVAEDLAGASLWFTAKPSVEDADNGTDVIQKSIGAGITVTDEPGGLATVEILPADTEDYTQRVDRTLVYDVQLETASGDIETIDTGTLVVKPDVTRA